MKKLLLSLLVVFISMAACDRVELSDTEESSNAQTVTVKAGRAGTKTAITEQDGNFLFTWKEGDQIALIEAVPSIAQFNAASSPGAHGDPTVVYLSNPLASDTDNAVFSLDLDTRPYLEGPLQYTAVYPAAVSTPGGCWDETKGRAIIPIGFPQDQRPTADSFDPESDVLVSRIVSCETRPTELSFSFARVGTIVKMVLSGLPTGTVITDGQIELGFEAGYYFEYDPVEQRMTSTDGTDGIRFNYEDGLETGSEGKATVWLRCMSGISDHIKLNLSGRVGENDCWWQRNISLRAHGTTLAFKEGGLTSFTVTIAQPDVENPNPQEIDYRTNENRNGVTVFWQMPGDDDPYLSGYDCVLLDEDGVRYEFNSAGQNDGIWEATINSGLHAGYYTLYVRSLAVTGKVSQLDYMEKGRIAIDIPLSMAISNSNSHDSSSDWNDLKLSEYIDTAIEDVYHGINFFIRNFRWRDGHMVGSGIGSFEPDVPALAWSFGNKSSAKIVTVYVKSSGNNNGDFDVYASNTVFNDGVPAATDTKLPYTMSGDYRAYSINKSFFLITGSNTVDLDEIVLEYYK